MPATSRNAFTEEDDSLLIRYLATVNPSGEGRSGNNLYIDYCDDLNQWPGTVTHPWQSWRDRYYRNREYFDYKIKKYTRKHLAKEHQKHPSTSSGAPKTKARAKRTTREFAERDPRKRKLSDYADAPRPKQPRRGTKTDTPISSKQSSSSHPRSHAGSTSDLQQVASTAEVDPVSTSRHSPASVDHLPLRTSASPSTRVTSDLPSGPGHIDPSRPNVPDSGSAESLEMRAIPSNPVGNQPRANGEASGNVCMPTPWLSTPLGSGTSAELDGALPRADLGVRKATLTHLEGLNGANDGGKLERADFVLDGPAADLEPQATSEDAGVADTNDAHTSRLLSAGGVPHSSQERASPPAGAEAEVIFVHSPVQPSRPGPPNSTTTVLLGGVIKKYPTKRKQSYDEEDPFTSAPCTPLLPSLRQHTSFHNSAKGASDPPRHAPAVVAPLAVRRRRSPPRLLDGAYGSRFSDAPVAGSPSETESDNEPKASQWPPVRARHGSSGGKGTKDAKHNGGQGTAKVKEESVAPTMPTRVDVQKIMNGSSKTGPHPLFFPTPHQAMTRAAEQRQGGRPKVAIVPLSFGGGPGNKKGEAVIASSRKGKERADDGANLRRAMIHKRRDLETDENKGEEKELLGGASPHDNPFSARNLDIDQLDRPEPSSSEGRSESGPRRVDLRTLHLRAARPSVSRPNSLGSTPGSHRGLPSLNALARSGSIREGTPPAIPEAEHSIITSLGIAHAMQLLIQTHGFSEEVTWNVWRETGSIVDTDMVLARMRGVAEQEGIRAISARRSSVRMARSETEDQDDVTHSSPHRSRAASLQIKPTQEDTDRMSEYSPPRTTRAGQFKRLMQQGRRGEALERLERRASSGGKVLNIRREKGVPDMTMWLAAKPDMEEELKTREAELNVDLFMQWTVMQMQRFF